ncbi:MAG: hypothetical protein CL916_03300 [Deltaproteobacteria bacterium]|nr:hypothetical protein [Deltaproteobacteria bacterium]
MAKIYPFRGAYPKSDVANLVIAPPYDVLSRAEAQEIVDKNPKSFLRVTRSEVDMPLNVDPHSAPVYEEGARRLRELLSDGVLTQDEERFYLYRQTWKGRTQVGLMALCDTQEYDDNLIKKHEFTRPDKEDDRTLHVDTLGAQTGLVFLTYRDQYQGLREILQELHQMDPYWIVQTDDSVEHALTLVPQSYNESIQAAFAGVEALYIADGHHRSAAASRVAKLRNREGTTGLFLAGIFPDSQLEVMAYNRVVQDLNGHSKDDFLTKVKEVYTLEDTSTPLPPARGTLTMYIDKSWYLLTPKEVPEDVVGRLDVALLQNGVLSPVLGIENPRTNKRIAFVGGIRGHQALVDSVDNGAAVAFHMYPTGIDQLLDVADADQVMPPKSTWFEPKLRGGVLLHIF